MKQVLASSVRKLLRPLVRILLRNGVPFGTFADLAKWVYVDVAAKDFGIAGRKQTDSRVSVITGLSRKEVRRVKGLPTPNEMGTTERYNRAARVIGGWVRDPSFQDAQSSPAALPIDGSGATFSQLVSKYSGDVPTRAVLDELLRVHAVERGEDDRIRLLDRAYVPRTGEDDKLGILGTDVAHLIATIDHNLVCDPVDAYFQRKVAYDNLPAEAIPEFRELVEKHAQALLEFFDRWLVERDRDSNPQITGTGRKGAGVGIYFFAEDRKDRSESIEADVPGQD